MLFAKQCFRKTDWAAGCSRWIQREPLRQEIRQQEAVVIVRNKIVRTSCWHRTWHTVDAQYMLAKRTWP